MGYDENYPLALPKGTILAGQYIIESVLGQGGFGITYKAVDHKSGRNVAVKEFFPDSMATRTQATVMSFSGERGESFTYGKTCFLQEAKTLAEFIGNENIVRVHSYFEENGTAYFVMDFVEGTSFDVYLKEHGGRISCEEAERILLPIMDALTAVHSRGIVHRDVTPDNIFITKDGTVKLLDFGAARYSLGDKSRSLDVVLKHGFAPKEQYTRHGKQGPFTDVYSVAATYYFAITGRRPPDSIDRLDEDELIRPSTLGVNISSEKEQALFFAMNVQPADRFQSMAAFRNALSLTSAQHTAAGPAAAAEPVKQIFFTQPNEQAQPAQQQAAYQQAQPAQQQAAYQQAQPAQQQAAYQQAQPAQQQAAYQQAQPAQQQAAYQQAQPAQQQAAYQQNAQPVQQQTAYQQNMAQTGTSQTPPAEPQKKKWIPYAAIAACGVALAAIVGAVAYSSGSSSSDNDRQTAKYEAEDDDDDDYRRSDTDASSSGDTPVFGETDTESAEPESETEEAATAETEEEPDEFTISRPTSRTIVGNDPNNIINGGNFVYTDEGYLYVATMAGQLLCYAGGDVFTVDASDPSCINVVGDTVYFIDGGTVKKSAIGSSSSEVVDALEYLGIEWLWVAENGYYFKLDPGGGLFYLASDDSADEYLFSCNSTTTFMDGYVYFIGDCDESYRYAFYRVPMDDIGASPELLYAFDNTYYWNDKGNLVAKDGVLYGIYGEDYATEIMGYDLSTGSGYIYDLTDVFSGNISSLNLADDYLYFTIYNELTESAEIYKIAISEFLDGTITWESVYSSSDYDSISGLNVETDTVGTYLSFVLEDYYGNDACLVILAADGSADPITITGTLNE